VEVMQCLRTKRIESESGKKRELELEVEVMEKFEN